MRPYFARGAAAALAASALALPFSGGSAMASAGPAKAPACRSATVPGSAPAWVRQARVVGAPAASAAFTFDVALTLRNEAAAEKLVRAVTSPASPRYRRYLTAAQFNARFGPTSGQIAKVEAYLRSQGVKVTGVAPGNRWVQASASTAQVERAFRTRLKIYSYHGRKLRAAAASLSVPASLRGLIAAFPGISQTIVRPGAAATASRPAGHPRAVPPPPASCSVFWGQHHQAGPAAFGRTSFPTPNCGYSPRQLRVAYGVQNNVHAGNNGRGVTVAIIDAYDSPIILADANAYSALQGEPAFRPGQFIDDSVNPATFNDQGLCGGEAGWNEEQTLDVEAVHGLAPGAAVAYVGAQNCDTGIDDALNFVVQNHAADIVSNSYGNLGEMGLDGEVALEHSIFLQGAAEGIGFYFSSGDDGDNTPIGDPIPEPDYPASDSLVTGVGGTSLGINSNGSYKFETAWGNLADPVDFTPTPAAYSVPLPGDFDGAAGGGTSRLFPQPSYQAGTVPKSLSRLNGPTKMRVVPDVGAVADPETGYLICEDAPGHGGTCAPGAGDLTQIGGTSLACPVFAAIQALVSQGRFRPIGFANPVLYAMPAAAFHDVRSSNAPVQPLAIMTDSGHTLLTMDRDSSLSDTNGYDNTTGRGTPDGMRFLLGEKKVLQGGR